MATQIETARKLARSYLFNKTDRNAAKLVAYCAPRIKVLAKDFGCEPESVATLYRTPAVWTMGRVTTKSRKQPLRTTAEGLALNLLPDISDLLDLANACRNRPTFAKADALVELADSFGNTGTRLDLSAETLAAFQSTLGPEEELIGRAYKNAIVGLARLIARDVLNAKAA